MAIKAILFDLDDTLIPSTQIYKKALKAVGLSDADTAYMNARQEVKKRLGKTSPASHNRLLYFKEIYGASGLAVMSRYENALMQETKLAWEKGGQKSVLEKLRSQFQLGIVSNENTRTQLIKLRAIDPGARLFKTIVTSEEVGVEKPSPIIFKEAFRRLNCSARECLMMGDNQECDIKPMLRLGGHALLVRDQNLNPVKKWLSLHG